MPNILAMVASTAVALCRSARRPAYSPLQAGLLVWKKFRGHRGRPNLWPHRLRTALLAGFAFTVHKLPHL